MIDALADQERCGGDTNTRSNEPPRRDVAPDGCPVYYVVFPDDRVDELYKALAASPKDVKNAAHVPCLQMPAQRDVDQNEPDERKRDDDIVVGNPRHDHDRECKREWMGRTVMTCSTLGRCRSGEL